MSRFRQADGLESRLDAALAHVRSLFNESRRATSGPVDAHRSAPIDDDWLSTRYVSGVHLHQTLARDELLTRIRELLINVVGAARFRIFLQVPKTGELLAIADETPAVFPGKTGDEVDSTTRHVVSTGTAFRATPQPTGNEAQPVACVPLQHEGEVLGAIRIDALLPRRQDLQAGDHELLEHLAEHASLALLAAGAWRCVARLQDSSSPRRQALAALLGEGPRDRSPRSA